MFYNPKLSHIWGQNANISEFYAANVARLYAKLTSLFAKKMRYNSTLHIICIPS